MSQRTTIYVSRPEQEDRGGPLGALPTGWGRPLVLTAAAVGAGALVRAGLKRRTGSLMGTEPGAALERSRSAMVGDIIMRWEEHGADRPGAIPVVLVHGMPTNPRLWRFVIPALRDPELRCIAWEMVGFGWSIPEGLARDISVARQAEYLDAFLHQMNIEQAILVGHDLGGGVVQRFAAAHPDRCLGVVLADSVAYDNWPVAAVRAARAVHPMIERLPSALLEPVLQTALRSLGHTDGRRAAMSVELHLRPYRTVYGAAGLAHQLRHLDNDDTRALGGRLAALDVPARVVWGERDPLGVPSGRSLAAELKAPLDVIAGARHFTPEDHPETIARAINEVVGEIRQHQRMVPVKAEAGMPGP